MSGKVLVMFALLAALVAASAAGEAQESSTLHRLLANREKTNDWSRRQDAAPQTQSARTQRRAHLSEDEREIVTKQIMQAISEMINPECMPDRDYQGWVDFGRRDAE